MKHLFICLVIVWSASAGDSPSSTVMLPRVPFDIPLAKLAVSLDEETGKFDRIRITYPGSEDQIFISRYNDELVENVYGGKRKTIFRESPELAYQISEFEAKHLNKVCKTFVNTLEIFEKDLQKERWGNCLYLDAYLPRFLKNFNFLLCAAQNSTEESPELARIPDEDFDVSQNSPKSDERLARWRSTPDYIVKLRIAAKELIYQTKQWQKKDLADPKRDPDTPVSSKFEEAFSLFVNVYFVNKPAAPVPPAGKHL